MSDIQLAVTGLVGFLALAGFLLYLRHHKLIP